MRKEIVWQRYLNIAWRIAEWRVTECEALSLNDHLFIRNIVSSIIRADSPRITTLVIYTWKTYMCLYGRCTKLFDWHERIAISRERETFAKCIHSFPHSTLQYFLWFVESSHRKVERTFKRASFLLSATRMQTHWLELIWIIAISQ